MESVVPRETWRGQFHAGTSPTTGARRDCPVGTQTGCLQIAWPGMQTNAAHSWGGEQPDIRVWYGGLVDGMRDASGQMYMRNRYYDPATGQFTQTDPIGLAGGLNAYGFAAGDPVSYSDPYGLAPDTVWIGVRPLENPILGLFGNHAAVRVDAGGRRQLGELLEVNGRNSIDVRVNPSRKDTDRYYWVRVDPPEGMTMEQFDAAVISAFNDVGRARHGHRYSSHGARNSNKFIHEVFREAGSQIPNEADRPPFTPGICGGNPKNRLDSGSDCKQE